MTSQRLTHPTVAIVGGGPSGLTAAAHLAPHVTGGVLVLEREREAGGIPRHSDHTGYGLRDLHRSLRGPSYAKRLIEKALDAGAVLATEATVTHLDATRSLTVTTPHGLQRLQPQAVILATGARERPRSARLIAGDRPAGVYTTGHLQNLVHLQHRQPGRVAVVVGAELVSWSAVLTLRESGCRTALMTTTYAKPESYAAFRAVGSGILGVPVATQTRLVRIEGRDRVQAVHLENLVTGRVRRVACDTVVLTGDWIPDNELSRMAGVGLAPGSRGPAVDSSLRTNRPGIFAIGNLIHPVDTAEVAALDGRHAAAVVRGYLESGGTHPAGHTQLRVGRPLRWITPSVVSVENTRPPRDRLLSWSDEWVRFPRLEVRQGRRLVGRHRVPWPAVPGRAFRIPWSVMRDVDPCGDDVRLTLS